MDWVLKGLLTAGVVAAVLMLAAQWGRCAAGFIASLPLTTAPSLAWVARDHGVDFAVEAARGTIVGCAVLAVFALVYSHLAYRARPMVVLGCATLLAALFAWPAMALCSSLVAAVALAIGCCALVWLAWPRSRGEPPAGRGLRGMTAIASVTSGGISTAVSMVVPALGTACAGLLSSVPFISLTVAVVAHAAGGQVAVLQFMRGCVAGLLGRIAFGAVAATTLGVVGLPWALGLAALSACGVNAVAARCLHRHEAAGSARRASIERRAASLPARA